MAVLDHLIEVFNSNNFFVPVSVCVAVGAVLLFTVIKCLAKSDKRHNAASVDVDDWDKEIQNGLKKSKQKKVKTSTNAQADSGSNSRSKVTGKQSAATKVTTPPAKEKQADEKPKSSAKKQAAASPVSSKSVQPTNEGEWLVAGSKKKQKNKKTVPNVKESKTKDQTDRQIKDVEEVDTHKTVADVAPKDVEPSCETQMDSPEQETVFEVRESVCDALTEASSEAEVVLSQPLKCSFDELPASSGIEEPVAAESASEARAVEGNIGSDPAGKEAKSKKSSKKKKSKVVTEPAQGTDLAVQTTAVTPVRQEDGGQSMANIPSGSVAKPESAKRVETIRKSAAGPTKGKSKDMVDENAEIVIPDASKDVVKVVSKSVVPDASKEVVPDPSKGMANVASKNVVADDSKETVPEASKDGLAPQLVVFDELGLKESSADVGQSVLKKKKKARKDM